MILLDLAHVGTALIVAGLAMLGFVAVLTSREGGGDRGGDGTATSATDPSFVGPPLKFQVDLADRSPMSGTKNIIADLIEAGRLWNVGDGIIFEDVIYTIVGRHTPRSHEANGRPHLAQHMRESRGLISLTLRRPRGRVLFGTVLFEECEEFGPVVRLG